MSSMSKISEAQSIASKLRLDLFKQRKREEIACDPDQRKMRQLDAAVDILNKRIADDAVTPEFLDNFKETLIKVLVSF